MNIPNQKSTKEEILFYAESEGPKVLKKLAKAINNNPLATHEVEPSGSCEDILSQAVLNPKAVIWKEMIKLCPDLIEEYESDECESDCDDDDIEIEIEDDDSDDEED